MSKIIPGKNQKIEKKISNRSTNVTMAQQSKEMIIDIIGYNTKSIRPRELQQTSIIYSQSDNRTPYVTLSFIAGSSVLFLMHKLKLISDRTLMSNFSVEDNGTGDTGLLKKMHTYISHCLLHKNIWHLIQNMSGVYNFAVPIEKQFGSKRLLQLIVWGAIGSALSIKIEQKIRNRRGRINTYHYGASGALLCLVFYCILKFPKRQIQFHSLFLPAWFAGILMFVQNALLFMQNEEELGNLKAKTSHIGHLGGCLSGISFVMVEKLVKLICKKEYMTKLTRNNNNNPHLIIELL